jgi:hypothetical protein
VLSRSVSRVGPRSIRMGVLQARDRAQEHSTLLEATSHGIVSWDFGISRDGVTIADIDMHWLRERAEVTIAGQPFTVCRTSMVRDTFEMQSGTEVLVRAQKAVLRRSFGVEFTGRNLELKALSIFTRAFGLFEHGIQIGRIGPTSWRTRDAVIDCSGEIPIPVQVFLFWLVVILWQRAANRSAP